MKVMNKEKGKGNNIAIWRLDERESLTNKSARSVKIEISPSVCTEAGKAERISYL